VVAGDTLLKFNLVPLAKAGLDASTVLPDITPDHRTELEAEVGTPALDFVCCDALGVEALTPLWDGWMAVSRAFGSQMWWRG
jgi:hypothetical protein